MAIARRQNCNLQVGLHGGVIRMIELDCKHDGDVNKGNVGFDLFVVETLSRKLVPNQSQRLILIKGGNGS
jgi:hypothetical protein